MKRFGKTKEATESAMAKMAENLQEDFSFRENQSVAVVATIWRHSHSNKIAYEYRISFVPGFNADCTQFVTEDWNSLVDEYYRLRRKARSDKERRKR